MTFLKRCIPTWNTNATKCEFEFRSDEIHYFFDFKAEKSRKKLWSFTPNQSEKFKKHTTWRIRILSDSSAITPVSL